MRWCDRRGIGYILGLPRNAVLERLAWAWTVPAQWHHHQTDDKVRLLGSSVTQLRPGTGPDA